MKISLTCMLMCTFLLTSAQLPNTELYMLTMLNNGEKITVKDPVYLSGFNPDGYNNQPYFINPRELYITTNMYDSEYTDFVRLDLQNEEYFRITATDSISEYSPTPRAINSYFSAVRVEKDGKTQSLWLYPEDHKSYGKQILNEVSNIGYHCWLSESEVALFLVDDPMQLAIGNINEDRIQIVLENIGRCFRQDPDGNLVFIHKVSAEVSYIKTYNPETHKITTVTTTRKGSEDFELLGDGTFLMAEGSTLYKLHPERDEYWEVVMDLAKYDIENITRLAVSRNRLVFVNNPKS